MVLDVLCAGGVIADVIARPVLRQPAKGTLELVDRIGVYVGGSAANTGSGLSRMGFRVALCGAIGNDGLGQAIWHQIEANGMDARWLIAKPGCETATTLVTVDAEGERTFLHALGAAAQFKPEDVPLREARSAAARVLHLGGYFGLPGLEGDHGEPAAALLCEAKELGFFTSLDGVWDSTGRWGELIAPLFPYVDMFCPSLVEAQQITGLVSPDDVADRLFALGVRRIVALTKGAAGAQVAQRDGARFTVPPAKVETIDSTGAGDAFVAGMLAGILRNDDLVQTSMLASAAGALATTVVGAATGIESMDAVLALAEQIRASIPSAPPGSRFVTLPNPHDH
jgi:sugar/nucleoside kinase (ribokinase family)